MARKSDGCDMEPILPQVRFEFCPIRASLGFLGRKWALLVLRDISFVRDVTFSQILRNNRGLTPRVLSMRLRDLRKEGVIERLVSAENPREIRYRLTKKGNDVIPILTAFIQYGIVHHAGIVFEDRKPREIEKVFPGRQKIMLGRLGRYAARTESKHGA